MMNFLDLLVIAAMALAAAGLVSTVLMFVLKNTKAQRICFYVVSVLSLYIGYVAFRILYPEFMGQIIVAVAMLLITVVAVVLERLNKSDKRFLVAKILVALALMIGMFNAFA